VYPDFSNSAPLLIFSRLKLKGDDQ
jgi:hypothetical protein